jgi:transposase
VKNILVPVLKPGQVVVFDNASPHKNIQIRCLIEADGCDLWYLPKYSPDLNKIEKVWANLKRKLRKFRGNYLNLKNALFAIFEGVKFSNYRPGVI